jgi:hypothetical protein
MCHHFGEKDRNGQGAPIMPGTVLHNFISELGRHLFEYAGPFLMSKKTFS